jgi:hypothetical protein
VVAQDQERGVVVYVIADVHLANHKRHGGQVVAGLNDRCRAVLATLTVAAAKARAARAPLLVLGDLFDSARPEPQVIAAAQQALKGVECYCLTGNHEAVSTAPGDHSLAPLHGFDMIEVVEQSTVQTVQDVDVVFVPHRPGKASEWLRAGVEEAVDRARRGGYGLGRRPAVLAAHLGIRDSGTPPWLRDSPGSVDVKELAGLCREHGIAAALAGDWHDRRCWVVDGIEIMQVGALAPTGFDNPGMDGYGTLASFDPAKPSGGLIDFEVLPGPRFIKLRAGDDVPPARGCRLYVQVTAPPEHAAACEEHVRAAVESGEFAAAEVVPDSAAAETAAREAAQASRSEETLDGALSAFVGRLDLPVGQGGRVLERCRRYLARGAT